MHDDSWFYNALIPDQVTSIAWPDASRVRFRAGNPLGMTRAAAARIPCPYRHRADVLTRTAPIVTDGQSGACAFLGAVVSTAPLAQTQKEHS
jgi:hypothetical protein